MIGNLNPNYLLRQDRIRRIEDAFARGSINKYEREKLLEQEGFGYLDSTFRPIGEVARQLVERLEP